MLNKGEIVRVRCPHWKYNGRLAIIRDIPFDDLKFDTSYTIAFTDDCEDWDTFEINEFYLYSTTKEERFLFHTIGPKRVAKGERNV